MNYEDKKILERVSDATRVCSKPNNFNERCYEMCPYRENGVCDVDAYGAMEIILRELTGGEVDYSKPTHSNVVRALNFFHKKSNEKKPNVKLNSKPASVAVYGGSFDPFHNGHMDILKQALDMFDKVYVVLLLNREKGKKISDSELDVAPVAHAIREAGISDDRCEVITWKGLLTDFCKKHGVRYNIRGLRNTSDFWYEETMAEANKKLYSAVETIYLRSKDPALSSSLIREMVAYKKDVSHFVPRAVEKTIKEKHLYSE